MKYGYFYLFLPSWTHLCHLCLASLPSLQSLSIFAQTCLKFVWCKFVGVKEKKKNWPIDCLASPQVKEQEFYIFTCLMKGWGQEGLCFVFEFVWFNGGWSVNFGRSGTAACSAGIWMTGNLGPFSVITGWAGRLATWVCYFPSSPIIEISLLFSKPQIQS